MIKKKQCLYDLIAFYKAVIGVVFSHGLALGISFIGSVILTRALGAEGRGVVAWVMSLSSIGIVLAQAGMGHTNRKFISLRDHRAPALFSLTVIICAMASLVVILVLAGIGLKDTIGYNNQASLFLALLLIPISAIAISSGEMLIGLRKNTQYSTLNIIEKTSNTLLVIYFIAVGSISPFTAVVAIAISAILRLSSIIYYLRHDIKLKLEGISYILSHIGAFTFFNYVASSALFIATHISVILVGSLAGVKQAGLFAANMIIINALRQLANTTGLFALPRLMATKNLKEKKKLKKGIIAITLFLTISAAIVFILSAGWLIPTMFGEEFVEAVHGFKILLVGMVFCSMLFIFQSFISSESNGYAVTIAPLILVVCTIVTNILLIPQYGALGATYSWGASHSVACIISVIVASFLRRKKYSARL